MIESGLTKVTSNLAQILAAKGTPVNKHILVVLVPNDMPTHLVARINMFCQRILKKMKEDNLLPIKKTSLVIHTAPTSLF